jgi:drug/metabolite transporter (DMT)-like permease
MRPRLKGLALMTVAAFGFSFAGFFVRWVERTSAWEIVFWRSLVLSAVLTAFLGWQYGRSFVARTIETGRLGVLAAFFLASTFFCFILALQTTTVANVVLIMSTTPFFAALMGRWILGEGVPPRTWFALAAAVVGVALMFWDSLSTGVGLAGNLFALGIAVGYAAQVVTLRCVRGPIDMVPSVLIAGLMAFIGALPLAWPLQAYGPDVAVLVLMGTFQIGIPLILLTVAARYLSATEVILLGMLEVPLGPLWVWLGFGERPTDLALVGGSVVLAALIGNAIAGSYAERRRL